MGMLVAEGNFSDIDELGQEIGWDLDFRQLERGAFQGTAEVIPGEHVTIMHVRFNRAFHQRGTPPKGFMTYGLLEPEVGDIPWCGANHSVDKLVDFNVPMGFDGATPSNHHAFTFSIAEHCLRETAENLAIDPEALSLDEKRGASLEERQLRTIELRSLFRGLFAAAGSSSVINGLQEKDLVSMLATELIRQKVDTRSPALNPSTRVRVCQRAVEFMDAYAADCISIADVCRAAGASLSTLERAFRDQFGVTPKRYLMNRQLIGVRRDLRSGFSETVHEVANRWGFWHMGQFGRDYKAMFGELPSQTLHRRRSEASIRELFGSV